MAGTYEVSNTICLSGQFITEGLQVAEPIAMGMRHLQMYAPNVQFLAH